MTDMAAGSTAARTLQQNVYGAQYDQANIAAAAQENQLKVQQEQANLEKTKLANLVSETGFKASEESKQKLRALADTPEFKAASDAQKLRLSAATQFQNGDIDNGVKTLTAAELYDSREVAVKQKNLDQQAQVIGNAYGVIAAVPDNKVDEFVANLPEESKKALVGQIGEANWNKMSGAEKKEATKNLMLNAKGQMSKQLKEIELEKTEMLIRSRERIAALREDGLLNRKLTGGSDREMRDWNLYNKAVEGVERSGKKTLEALDKNVEAAQSKLDRAWLFKGSETDEYAKAVKARDDFKRNQLKKEINLTTTAPDFPGKASILENLNKELELFGPEAPKPTPIPEDKPAPKPAAKAEAAPAKPSATSNKPPAKLSEAENSAAIDKANEAIKKGADPAKVKARLKELGVSFKE